jgi:hypothetical protein
LDIFPRAHSNVTPKKIKEQFKMNFSSLFFISTMLFQCVQAQDEDDTVCTNFGTLANLRATAIQDVLNNRLGGEEEIDGIAGIAFDSYEIAFEEPSFDGCEVTISAGVMVDGVSPNPDQEGSASFKGTWDYAALLEGEFCVTDIQVTDLEIGNFPDTLENFIEAALLSDLDVPDVCVPLFGFGGD